MIVTKKSRAKCFLGICLFTVVLGCSPGSNDIIPGRSVKRLSASESGIDVSVFSDTTRALYGSTTDGRVPLSQKTRLEIKKILEEVKFARLEQSWKFAAEVMLMTDDSKPEQLFLFFEGGFIQSGQDQYYVGVSWEPIVKKVNDDHEVYSRHGHPDNQQ
jgi:hypothetical protein